MNPYSAHLPLAFGLVLTACQQSDVVAEAAAKSTTAAPTAANPVVVELYQSQGCSSCPPANAALNAVADKPGVIALSFAVTYWDRLGWKDIFADKAYTQRQYDYARMLGNANVATPQIIINGQTVITGIKRGELAASIASAKPVSGGPAITVEQGILKIGKGSGMATVWLVRYDPRVHNVAIRSGENTGRTLPHKNIVRSLSQVGEWRGEPTSFKLPAVSKGNLKMAILVQRAGTGAIIAAKAI